MYLVIGGNGFLGSYLIHSILENTNEEVIATARNVNGLADSARIHWEKCDIRNSGEFDLLMDKVRQAGDVKVFFLAAYHNPDQVSENPQLAWDINVTALSACINKLSFCSRIFYASTDSVYGNSYDNYHFKETDSLHPVNEYGRNKAAAEAVVTYAGFHVIRFPFLIAPSLVKDKKHFYDKIVMDLLEKKEVQMFCDSYRSSLNFKTAADLAVRLSQLEEVPQVLNVCGDQDLSKYDIGLKIADKLGVSRALVKPVRLSENEDIFKTQRAVSTLMDNELVKSVLKLDSIEFAL